MNRISKDDIRTLIVVLSICIICVALVLILNIKSNTDKMENVTDYNTFFSTANYINTYIDNVYNKKNKKVYDLLDKKYITINNKNKYNIFDIVETYEENVSAKVSKIEQVKINEGYVYYIKASLIQNLMDEKNVINNNFEVIVIADNNNKTASIYPVDNKDYKKIINSIKRINIEKNGNNSIPELKEVTKEQICSLYLDDYVDKIVNSFDTAYEILSYNMKKTYETKEKYKEYIYNNVDKITVNAVKCKMETIEDEREYTVIDDKENIYKFTENSVMNYEVEIYLKEISLNNVEVNQS